MREAIRKGRLNLAAYGVAGASFAAYGSQISPTSVCGTTQSSVVTLAASMPRSTSAPAQSTNACAKWQHGYGLIDTRVDSKRVPSSATSAEASLCSGTPCVRSTPSRPSNTVMGPVMPSCAMRAATMPEWALQPVCSALADEPFERYSLMPDAWLPARPRACAVRSADSPNSRAAATAAPNTPATDVVWKPRRWNVPREARPTRAATSHPATNAVTISSPGEGKC